jgi:hypothetical protein
MFVNEMSVDKITTDEIIADEMYAVYKMTVGVKVVYEIK